MPRRKKQRSIYVTKEPEWKTLALITEPEEQESAFRSCEYFVRTEIPRKQVINACKKWIKDASGWSKEEIKLVLANPEWSFSAAGLSCYVWYKLGYMPEGIEKHYQERRKEEWLKRGKVAIKEKQIKAESKPKKVISIQERMKQQVNDLCAEWEHQLDCLTDGQDILSNFDPYKEMLSYQPEIKANHAKIIKEDFEPQYQEALEVVDWKDEQIKESYGFLTAKQRKEYLAFFEKINTACDTIIETKKTTRKARKPRARSKESIIKKLKFQINDSELGIASIHPTEIVNANEVWVYNTKTRKLGVYHARSKDPRNMGRDGLTVKGTTIQDFNPDLSLQKTLRKPKEQISNWTGKAKTKFAKAFDELTTTGIKLNGRINDKTIILKAF
jgi:hypothetical protein|tara:strand:+ start:664 stop:1821 length:1158 start_codon:yes stop_codon:yes gene_type:complete